MTRRPPRPRRPEAPARPRPPDAAPPAVIHAERDGPAPAHGACLVLYKDVHLVMADKGPGLLTVPTDRGNPPTVLSAIHHRLRGAHDTLYPVHRLDRDTSGVLVVARTRKALGFLVGELRRRNFARVYLALVHGTPPESGTLKSHLGTRGKDLRMRSVDEGEGKLAITHFRVVEQATDVALVAVKLDTGRRNQIRAQLAELGFPLLGEEQYADATSPLIRRQALHSHRLTLPHPDGRRQVDALSPMPEDMLRAWRKAGGRHGPVLRANFEIPAKGAPVFDLQDSSGAGDDDEEGSPPPAKNRR